MGFEKLSLKARALRCLALREHSRLELTQKLLAHEQTPGELSQLLDSLEAKGYIDTQRVIDSVLHRRAARWGAARVRQELQAKGLDGDAVNEALAGLKDSEQARAQALWESRFGSVALDLAARAKQTRFLLTRGFSAEVVRRVVNPRRGADSDVAQDAHALSDNRRSNSVNTLVGNPDEN
jgi:regulatory protein